MVPDLPSCGERRCARCPKEWNRTSICIEADAIAVEAACIRWRLGAPNQRDLDEYDLAHPDEI